MTSGLGAKAHSGCYLGGCKPGSAGRKSILGSRNIGEGSEAPVEAEPSLRGVPDSVAEAKGLPKRPSSWLRGLKQFRESYILCICSASSSIEPTCAPPRIRLKRSRASTSETVARVRNRSCCSAHRCCSASLLRFSAMMGGASAR